MDPSVQSQLIRVFGGLLSSGWPTFHAAVVSDVLKMDGDGPSLPTLSVVPLVYFYHGRNANDAKICTCLFDDVDEVSISSVPFARYRAHMIDHTIPVTASEKPARMCTTCNSAFLDGSRIFVYHDKIFRAVLVTKLFPATRTLTTLDISRFEDRLENIHLLYAYLFLVQLRPMIDEMSRLRLDTAWATVKLNFAKTPALKLTGPLRWSGINSQYPVMYAHEDEARCTCITTSIDSCCGRFDFDTASIPAIGHMEPWKKGIFFISLSRAIHHLAFHVDTDDALPSGVRACTLCLQQIHLTDFALVSRGQLEQVCRAKRASIPVPEPRDAMLVDSEADIDDRSPQLVIRDTDSHSALKRNRPSDHIEHSVSSSSTLSEPSFKKARTVEDAIAMPTIRITSQLPKATDEILNAIFAMAFEDSVLRNNLDQWVSWISRYNCQPATRFDGYRLPSISSHPRIVAKNGFTRLNNATELSSVVIYIPQMTAGEMRAEYTRIRSERPDAYQIGVKRGTTQILCRNAHVTFPYTFDFARMSIVATNADRLESALAAFVSARSGGSRILRVDSSLGVVEITIEPLVLSLFDEPTGVRSDVSRVDESEPRSIPIMEVEETLRDSSYSIRVTPIQDNLEINQGSEIDRPSTDIIVVTPHHFALQYPTMKTALFAAGDIVVDKNRISSSLVGFSVAPISLTRIAAGLGLVAPSVPRMDVSIPLTPDGSNIETYGRDERDQRAVSEAKMAGTRKHLRNPLMFVPVADLTDMIYWPRGSGFMVRADVDRVHVNARKTIIGIGADGFATTDANERVELQVCPIYKNPKTGAIVLTYEGRWLLQFMPETHGSDTDISSYTVSTNRYLWDTSRTPCNTNADFEVACGPRISFFCADLALEQLRTCIDPCRSVGSQLGHMTRIGSDASTATSRVPQLKDHYSIVRIYTRAFKTMLDINFVRSQGNVFSLEAIATQSLDLYWRAAVPATHVIDNTTGQMVPPANDAEHAAINLYSQDQCTVRLMVRKAGFYRITDILDAPVFATQESRVISSTGRQLFASDSPMLLPAFQAHGKVHLVCNSIEQTAALDVFEKFQLDRRNMMQMVLAATIAKRVIAHPSMPFVPIQGHAAVRYTHMAHNSPNVHQRYPWIAGVFPWLTFDLNMPLDTGELRSRQAATLAKGAAGNETKSRSRSQRAKYEVCSFCQMLTLPITSEKKPVRHSQLACPLFFEYSNSERSLLEFVLHSDNVLTPSFKEKLLIKTPSSPNVNGYRLNIPNFESLRNKIRVGFASCLTKLVKCENSIFGPVYAEELKIKYSAICIPPQLPWITLLRSFYDQGMLDIATNGSPANDDHIIALDDKSSGDVSVVAPSQEMRQIFRDLHRTFVVNIAATEQLSEEESSSLSSSSAPDART